MPKISFRGMLMLMTLGGIVAAIARGAGSGRSLAVVALTLIGYGVSCLLLSSIACLLQWGISVAWYRGDEDTLAGSPFAEGQLPPQILPPQNPIDS